MNCQLCLIVALLTACCLFVHVSGDEPHNCTAAFSTKEECFARCPSRRCYESRQETDRCRWRCVRQRRGDVEVARVKRSSFDSPTVISISSGAVILLCCCVGVICCFLCLRC